MTGKKRGIVLLEILIALVVFSAGIVFLVQSLSLLVRNDQRMRQQTLAAVVAENTFCRCLGGELQEREGKLADGFAWRWETERLNSLLRRYTIDVFKENNPHKAIMTVSGVCLPLASL